MKTSFAAIIAASALFVLVGCNQDSGTTTPGTTPPTETPKTTAPDTTTDTTKTEAPKTDAPKTDAATAPTGDVDSQGLANKPKDGDDVAVLDTAKGKIVLMFFPDKAPTTVTNFLDLAKAKFYDGTRFHRCIPGFMVQGGDPKSKDISKAGEWGTGGNMVDGKEKNVADEFNSIQHKKGIVSMAHSMAPNSASSQFFIVTDDSGFLDGKYTAFGKVVSGQDVVDQIVLTGSKDPSQNGAVDAAKAIVLKSVKVAKWPVK